MKKILSASALLVLLVSLAVHVPRASACSCIMPEPPLAAKDNSAAVFSGRVTGIKPPVNMTSSLDESRITFDVLMSWKGIDRNPVQIFSSTSSASCGYEFEEGKEYLVYAYDNEGRLSTGLCTRTALLADAAEDLAALGAGTIIEPGPNDDIEEDEDKTALVIAGAALLAVIAGAYYFFRSKRR